MKKIYPINARRQGRIAALIIGCIVMLVIGATATSCKAWRTVTTTATYVQAADSTKTTATITTKTVEEYQGVKKK